MQRLTIAVVVVIIIVVFAGGLSTYYAYQQPNIQATAMDIGTPSRFPTSSFVINQGRVSGSGSFSYTANLSGVYYMVFDNIFSLFSDKSVHVVYSISGSNYDTSLTVPAGESKVVEADLIPNQQLSGNFSISGGSGNDVNFFLQANTCRQVIPFDFTLVNSGNSNGYAVVNFTVDGASVWSNKYYVTMGSSQRIDGNVTIADCGLHLYNIIVSSQHK